MIYRQSNKQLSGKYAALNGKKISWEQNVAPANPTSPWGQVMGKIIRVATDGKSYYVRNDHDGASHWIDAKWDMYRNIVVASPERESLDRIHQNMAGWSEPE